VSNRLFSVIYPVCYRIMMTVLLAGVVINGIGHWIGIAEISSWNWILLICLSSMLSGLHYGKTNEKLLCSIALVLSVVLMIPLIGAGQIGGFFENYANWLIGSAVYESEWMLGYGLMQMVWVVLVCYFFEIIFEKKQIVNDIAAMLLVISLLVCMLLEIRVRRAGVICIILYGVVTYIQRMRKNWDKKKRRDSREYILFLIPFLSMYLFVLSVTPTSEKPYDWNFVKELYENLSEKATIWWENRGGDEREDFGASSMGFSEERKLVGNLEESDKHIMKVKGDVRQVTTCYLRGKSYDTFDGREWKKTVKEDIKEYPLDSLELLYAMKRYDPDRTDQYICIANLSIKYEYFNTGHLFAPGKLLGIRNMDYKWNASDAVFEEQKGYGTEYGLSYYQLNVGGADFEGLLESEQEDDEVIWGEMLEASPSWLKRSYTVADFISYRGKIRENYEQKIELSGKAKDYLEEVTKGCTTDLQILKAIEKELSSYTYTHKPGNLPDRVKSKEDFLDYFLLESKQGFCSHFATAFVLLAEAEGLPARYVEGFCIPLTDSKYMQVSANMTHAWPEVYLEGIGWIPFEPTPGYGSLRYSGWEASELNGIYGSEKATATVPEENTQETKGDNKRDKEAEKQRMEAVLSGGLVFFAICLAVFFAEKLVQKLRYKRMNIESRFLVEIRKNLWIFARLGYRRGKAETLSELQERIRAGHPQWLEERKNFVCFEAYQEFLYRGANVTEKLLQEIQKETKELLLAVKEEHKLTYWKICIALLFRMSI